MAASTAILPSNLWKLQLIPKSSGIVTFVRAQTCQACALFLLVASILMHAGAADTTCTHRRCCLKQLLIRRIAILIEQYLQGLLVDARLRKLHFRVLAICCINNGGAADLRHFFAMTIKGPATDFTWTNHILNKEYSLVKTQRQLVKQFNILEQIIIRGACVRVFVILPLYHQNDRRLRR